jgi:hypothetical protein
MDAAVDFLDSRAGDVFVNRLVMKSFGIWHIVCFVF